MRNEVNLEVFLTDYNTLTNCEAYGHSYRDDPDEPGLRVCTECGDHYYTDTEDE